MLANYDPYLEGGFQCRRPHGGQWSTMDKADIARPAAPTTRFAMPLARTRLERFADLLRRSACFRASTRGEGIIAIIAIATSSTKVSSNASVSNPGGNIGGDQRRERSSVSSTTGLSCLPAGRAR